MAQGVVLANALPSRQYQSRPCASRNSTAHHLPPGYTDINRCNGIVVEERLKCLVTVSGPAAAPMRVMVALIVVGCRGVILPGTSYPRPEFAVERGTEPFRPAKWKHLEQ